ncbi:MAG: FAD-binding oxidoreductase [Gammaproteobacteria bacterium]|nr:FAD-binding oxidoreductase [Gammaproteobacteria bacterium]
MPSKKQLTSFLTELELAGFQGDIESSYAERIVAATDNSIYQLKPEAILYPRELDDINRIMSCVNKHQQAGFSVCARGGGTGTNGQSLSDNLILDCSRFLNSIISFDKQQKTVTVQPGVVLDQLNDFLKPHGLFFPIDISSSSRATLGGMVATDASGKGSLIYGKTSNHIQSLDLVLADGSSYRAENMTLKQMTQLESVNPAAYQLIHQHKEEIDRIFPKMDRGLTGYNLQQCISQPGSFNPCYLIAGSEGTLALTREITLRVTTRPTHKMLTVIFYDDFLRGLEHVQPLLDCKPAAIEMLDDKVLNLARNDSIWFDVQSVLDGLPEDADIKAANFVEHVGQSEKELEQYQLHIDEILDKTASAYRVIHSEVERDQAKISSLWNLRKKAVGLLGQSHNGKRGVAFVEDTAVPPQNLASYVTGFKQLLDDNRLDYGMYGHADAGVLHVRPTLNLLQADDRKLIRKISDGVAQLAKQHGGVLWGEHGRGFRGEFTPLFFGEKLYPVVCEVKKMFDPGNLLNPGKLTTPDINQAVIALDDITLRGELDAQITSSDQKSYADSLACNGNGACYNWQLDEAMCPSYKATRNKLYSPKGRAAMLREWLRLKNTSTATAQLDELEQTLFKSLQHCLSCKSCTTSCPLKVDIPELKSRFLQNWYTRNPRPISSFFNRYFETLISIGQRFPGLSNALLHNKLGQTLLQSVSGLNRLPEFSIQKTPAATLINNINIKHLGLKDKSVILLRDNYLQSFDRQTLQASCDVLQKLGYQVYLSEVIHNGKLLHVKGYRSEFKKQAQSVMDIIQSYADTGLPLISLETVTRLMFDMEYAEILQQNNKLKIHSIESFLLQALQQKKHIPDVKNQQQVTLLPHCMEQTTAKESSLDWQAVFEKLGIPLKIINAGCCGMSGLFGHELENNQLSDNIFDLYWKPTLQASQKTILASGFSCRCQTKNHHHTSIHPVVHLSQILTD